jgi:hypothetical protein
MGSPRCTLNRWGNVSNNCYTPKTEESKEMEDRLKKMMAERDKVDTMWQTTTSISTNNNTQIKK